MVYFRNPQLNRRVRRLVRDHVHFKEEIFEYAERIIRKFGDFKFSCIHVRRNEFQFEDVRIPADEIRDNTEGLFKSGEAICIATDELSKTDEKNGKHVHFDPLAMTKKHDHTWFEPIISRYGSKNVHFLDEYFEETVKDAPKIWIGCVESVVCSRSRVFVGTILSTFS